MLNIYQLEAEIEAGMTEARVPGLAVAIVQDGGVAYARGFGATAVEGEVAVGLPVTPATLFRIGSVTKPLTGTLLMRLVEQGRLDLDRPVTDYVPWLTFSEEGRAQEVTLRMLLSHTTGLATAADHFGSHDPEGLEAFIREVIPTYDLLASPGKVWSYSNPGVSLAGYVAEVVTETPYATLMEVLVFEPLEMDRTTFDPTVAMTYPLAHSHDLDGEGRLHVQHQFADNVGHYPAGFAISTVLDLANFALMQMQGGRFNDKKMLSPEAVAEMQRPQANLYRVEATGYGLTLFSRDYKGVRLVGHGGTISTFQSSLQMAPDKGVAVIVLMNRIVEDFDPTDLVHTVLDRLLDLPETAPEPEPISPETSRWPQMAGTYLGPQKGLAEVRALKDQLVLVLSGQEVPLTAVRPDLYVGPEPAGEGRVCVGFVEEADGPVEYIVVDSAPCRRVEAAVAAAPEAADLAAYVGTFRAPFDTLKVRLEDEELIVHSEGRDIDVRMMPMAKGKFSTPYGVITFETDDTGTVTALALGPATFDRVEEN